ncbi:MAG: cell division protein FtsZ [Candidatus Thermoplasmatota archaeon]
MDKKRIAIIGCGGAGNNSVDRLHKKGLKDVETIAINTDSFHCNFIEADKKVIIGKDITCGLGTGRVVEIGAKCAEVSRKEISEVIGNPELVFLTLGLGGGTGTGAGPIIGEIAKENGAVVVGIVTLPFSAEGRHRREIAFAGVRTLIEKVDTVIVNDNDRLLHICRDQPLDKAFSYIDNIVGDIIKDISEGIETHSLINLSLRDVKEKMRNGGLSTVLYGEAPAFDPSKVVSEALNSPSFDVDYSHANGAFIQITGGKELTPDITKGVEEGITYGLSKRAKENVLLSATYNPNYTGKLKVVSVMTGLQPGELLSMEKRQLMNLNKNVKTKPKQLQLNEGPWAR